MDEVGRTRWRVGLGAVVVLVLVAVAVAVIAAAVSRPGGVREVAPTTSPTLVRGPRIAVHVLGAVQRPGFYELRDGDRVLDAIAAAGGLTEVADPAGVNLARFVTDGEQLRVPEVGEVPVAPPGVSAGGLVNLNTADAATLESLPGIGPTMADRIIAWREANGGFGAVDQLRSVTGIGDRTFAELEPLVTV